MQVFTIESQLNRNESARQFDSASERELARYLREQMVLRRQMRIARCDPVFNARIQSRLEDLNERIESMRQHLAQSIRERRSMMAA